MEDLILNFEQYRKDILAFLKRRFPNTPAAELSDSISVAIEKILIDAAKREPRLRPTFGTWRYLSNLAAIDNYRKMRWFVSADFSSENTPLSISTDDRYLEKKVQYELMVDKIQELRPRLRHILSLKYAVQNIDHATTVVDMMAFRNHQKPMKSLEIATMIGSTSVAVRQDVLRATAKLQRLCA